MFSKELEEMIDAVISDGVITDKERDVLRKRAALEHYGRDEFDILLDARLSKKKAELKKEFDDSFSSDNLMNGDGGSSMTSAKKMMTAIQKIEGKWAQIIAGEYSKTKKNDYSSDCKKEIKDCIKLFPVPSNKEDLLDFISVLADIRHDRAYEQEYFQKFNEAINNAKTSYGNDPQFIPLFERYSKIAWENLTTTQRVFVFYAVAFVLSLILAAIMSIFN